MLIVDTNVLVDVLQDDPEWADWSIGQLRAQSKVQRLAINPIIYAELSLTFSTVEAALFKSSPARDSQGLPSTISCVTPPRFSRWGIGAAAWVCALTVTTSANRMTQPNTIRCLMVNVLNDSGTV